MKITLKKEWYKGTDGSSLSDERCLQFISLYEFTQALGLQSIDYKTLQVLATEKNLYAPAKSAKVIRTFCPLLSKIGFVNYDGTFLAKNLFTKDGKLFIQTIKALAAAKAIGNKKLFNELTISKQKIQRLGLLNMHANPEYKYHNIWIAIDILNQVGEINWDNFGYAIYLIKGEGLSCSKAIEAIEKNESSSIVYEYYKEDGTKLANTYYSYIHSYLLEAGVISDYAQGYSQVCDEAEDFLESLK